MFMITLYNHHNYHNYHYKKIFSGGTPWPIYINAHK